VNKIPLSKRVFVTSHDAFAYLSSDYGLTCHSLFGVDTNSQPSAKNMVTLVELIRAQSIKGVFVENITNPALVEQVAEETHVPVLGTLYSDALSAQGPATSYVDLLRHNITLITGSWE
jgi:zinc/manganese transport system substrate-binding protein